MLKRTLKRAAIGAFIGIGAGNLISCLSTLFFGDGGPIVSQNVIDMCGGEAAAMLLQTLLTAVMGAIDCAGMSFYEMEHWSLFRIIMSHLVLIFAAFAPVAYILEWVPTISDLIIVCVIMLVSYFIVWLIMCAVYKSKVKELNEMQGSQNEPDEK